MDIVQDGESGLFLSSTKHAETRRVAAIARKLVLVAKVFVKQQLKDVVTKIQAKLPSDITNEQLVKILETHREYQEWTVALKRLEGDWSYLLLETSLPNAFVTEILPQRIFITTAMFQFIENDDELALILGHEISHLVLGHLSEQNMIETMLRTVEVLLLSMDPTEGVLALVVIGVLATLRTAFAAAHSRDHEREADELGIQLAAMACFNTKRAAKVFAKLHENETGGGTQAPKMIRFVDTHPSSADRYRQLVLASETENAEKYATTTCQSVASRLRKVMQ
jgi:Zn-dependent protease with chaperone function